MVKILSLEIFRHRGESVHPVKLAQVQDLSDFSFFTRSSIGEHLTFASRTITQNTPLGIRQSVNIPDTPYLAHTYVRADGLAGVAVCDKEYVSRAAYAMINNFLAEYDQDKKGKWKQEEKDCNEQPIYLGSTLHKWQNPEEADKMMKIQKNIDDIKNVMQKNIEQVLVRGQKLEDLMEKSEDLSSASKQFYKQAKKTNQCCKMY